MTRFAVAVSLVPVIHAWSVSESVAEDYPLTLDDITVRDPFIHGDIGAKIHYLYAQTGNRGGQKAVVREVEAYRSKDLCIGESHEHHATQFLHHFGGCPGWCWFGNKKDRPS